MKHRFYYSFGQECVLKQLYDIDFNPLEGIKENYVLTPQGWKRYTEWCSSPNSKCNWKDAELVFETDDAPKIDIRYTKTPVLKQKDQQICDLEAKLAVADDCADRYWKQLGIVEDEIDKLKQQLTEKEKEIANREKILVLELKSTIEYIEHCEELKYHNGLKNIKNHFLEHLKEYENGNFEIIDKYHNQEKIKFAVEQLEDLKRDIDINAVSDDGFDGIMSFSDFKYIIDNQIKKLREGK